MLLVTSAFIIHSILLEIFNLGDMVLRGEVMSWYRTAMERHALSDRATFRVLSDIVNVSKLPY
jgi:hypothetical protein